MPVGQWMPWSECGFPLHLIATHRTYFLVIKRGLFSPRFMSWSWCLVV